MAKCEKLWGDGTFKQSPKHFYQLYTIHGYVKGQMFPFIFAVLPNKYEVTYIRMLKLLQDKLRSIGLRFEVKQFQIDFEIAMINAIQKVINCEVKGCAFHFSQSLIKKMKALGMTKYYKTTNSASRKIVRYSMALVFLKPELIISTFNSFQDFLLAVFDPEKTKCKLFLDYMKNNYISVENTVQFPSTIWNHYHNFKDRTNNKIEGWHNGLNLNKSIKPNIYKFIENLVQKQVSNDRLVKALLYGEKPISRPRRKYLEINQKIAKFTQELDARRLDAMSYLANLEVCLMDNC